MKTEGVKSFLKAEKHSLLGPHSFAFINLTALHLTTKINK